MKLMLLCLSLAGVVMGCKMLPLRQRLGGSLVDFSPVGIEGTAKYHPWTTYNL